MTAYEVLKWKAFGIVGQGRIKCAYPGCTVTDIDALHIDHIHNDGCRDRRRHSKAGGIHSYRYVVNNPEAARRRLQILCAIHDRMKQRHGSVAVMVERQRREERDTAEFRRLDAFYQRYRHVARQFKPRGIK
jgi:hypothetical protein